MKWELKIWIDSEIRTLALEEMPEWEARKAVQRLIKGLQFLGKEVRKISLKPIPFDQTNIEDRRGHLK